MQIFTTSIDSKDYKVVILPCNWKDKVKLKIQVPSSVNGAMSLMEHRRPNAHHLRYSLSYTTLVSGLDETEEFKTFWKTIGSQLCIIPLWPDVRTSEADRLFTSRLIIGSQYSDFSESFIYDNDIPTSGYWCSALVGRFNKPKYVGITGRVITMSVSFIEDSPFKFRVKPRAVAPSAWNWEHNWKEKYDQDITQGFKLVSMGNSREDTIDGYDDPIATKVTYGQNLLLSGETISEFMSFFRNRQGDVKTFYMEPSQIAAEVRPPDGELIDLGYFSVSGGYRMEPRLEEVTTDFEMSSEETTEGVYEGNLNTEEITTEFEMGSEETTEGVYEGNLNTEEVTTDFNLTVEETTP